MQTDLITKNVPFNGAELLAIQENQSGKIYVGINCVLRELGFDERQIEYRRHKWNEDKVISKGIRKFLYPSKDGGNQETYCIGITKLPLALAKIEITPKMGNSMPNLSEKLEQYQEQCADTLAEAFVEKKFNRQNLSPTLQMVYALADNSAKIELEQKRQAEQIDKVEKSVTTMKEIFTTPIGDWKAEINARVREISVKSGISYQELYGKMYGELENVAHCSLKRLCDNKKARMEKSGNTKTAIKEGTTKIAVIYDKPQLKAIFENIVKRYAMSYCA